MVSPGLFPAHPVVMSHPRKGDPELRAEVGSLPVPQLPSLTAAPSPVCQDPVSLRG